MITKTDLHYNLTVCSCSTDTESRTPETHLGLVFTHLLHHITYICRVCVVVKHVTRSLMVIPGLSLCLPAVTSTVKLPRKAYKRTEQK